MPVLEFNGTNGNDVFTVTTDQWDVNMKSGEDLLIINYGSATTTTDVDGSFGLAWVDTGGGSFSTSTRRVDFTDSGFYLEHLNATTGSGNDRLEGRVNSWDIFDGGAGVDEWEDYFYDLSGPMSVDMALVSSAGGQTFADGTTVRNLEIADLDLTNGNDTFRDFGAYDDDVRGDDGDDDLGTSQGRDIFRGGTGEDTLTIDWSTATQTADVDGSFGLAWVDTGGGSFSSSTRRVDFVDSGFYLEHIVATTGSGNDRLEGRVNSWDIFDGGAGDDEWEDYFYDLSGPMSVDMALVSSAGGQTFADGTTVRNLEIADLDLTNGNDTFRDFGAYDDDVRGDAGNDDLGTSQGRDIFRGGQGEDTLTIDWSTATQTADVDGSFGLAWVDTGGGSFSGSTRRVDFVDSGFYLEHIVATTGSGNDRLEGRVNSWDIFDGGAGDDEWEDYFFDLTEAMSVDMALVSSAIGQTFADGTTVRNLEIADLDLTDGDDTFRDFGDYDDDVRGDAGDDDLGTSQGRDIFRGGTGEDTLTIDWSSAGSLQHADVDGSFGLAWVNISGIDTFSTSTRRVDFVDSGFYLEHIVATTGAGDDRLEGRVNSWDIFDGGAGDDEWEDYFFDLAGPMSVDMALVSSAIGQTFADGTTVRNLEIADLDLTNGDDTFRDFGDYDDDVKGDAGDDDLGTSQGRDIFRGGTGEDTLTIDWSTASQNADIDGSFGLAWVDTGVGTFSGSTRRVDFVDSGFYLEHIVATTGSGNDRLEGRVNSWDVFDGGAGDDEWVDNFSAALAPMDVNMESVSSAGGQTFGDGSTVRNIEIANIDLTGGNDTFRDFGDYDDQVRAGNGDDHLSTTQGRDSFKAGGGVDTLIIDWSTATQVADVDGSSGQAWVDTGAGTFSGSTRRVDFIDSGFYLEHLHVTTGSANDRLEGRSNEDRLKGGSGDDVYDGAGGTDTALFDYDRALATLSTDGFGVTTVTAAEGVDTLSNVEFLQFADMLVNTSGVTQLNGDEFDNALTGTAAGESMSGFGGNDIIDGSGGDDTLDGGTGTDTLSYATASAGVTVDLSNTGPQNTIGAGTDTQTNFENLNGSVHNDDLTGDANNNIITGGAGDDIIDGGAGLDSLDGGAGLNDKVDYSTIHTAFDINLATGVTSLAGETAVNFEQVDLGNGVNNVTGSAGDDVINTTGGDDVLNGGLGDDTLNGGLGNDTASYADAASGITQYLTFSGINTGGAGTDTLTGIENLTGSAFDDRLVGDANDNIFIGASGNDVIKGKDGNDTFNGGDGDDKLVGGSGNDTMFGGDGADTLIALAGTDILNGGNGIDLLFGGKDSDTLNGDAGADKLRGNLGVDTLNGGTGADDLRGGGSNDFLNGGADNDFLFGQNHADRLDGGAGNDVMTGGSGGGTFDGFTDTFVYADTGSGNGGFDRIKDFENGIDVMDLQNFGFANFAAVQALTSNSGVNMRINFGGGDVLFVENFQLADFDAGDVLL